MKSSMEDDYTISTKQPEDDEEDFDFVATHKAWQKKRFN
jgi:hypothetical protein